MTREITIEAGKTERQYFRDLWTYKELFLFLAWRDVIIRYKQTVIGLAWSLIRPLVTMVVFTIVFGKLARLEAETAVPYAVLVFAGVLPWQFFSTALTASSQSVIANASMVSKIYFPRLIIPTSAVIVCLVDFLISFLILLGLMAWYQFIPGWQILMIPVFVVVTAIAAIGPGLWFAALNVKYRDFRIIVPFIVQIGMYISPVGFSSQIVPERWRLLYALNPMVGVIDGFRWSILGAESDFHWQGYVLSLVLILSIFLSGLWYFRRTEKAFADFI